MAGWGGGVSMNRKRFHKETDYTYNPDLEYAQQGYADALYGRGAPIGSWGMTGGQYPTVGKDRPGYGSNMYDNPWDFHSRAGGDQGLANENYARFGGPPNETPPGGGTGIYPGWTGTMGEGGMGGQADRGTMGGKGRVGGTWDDPNYDRYNPGGGGGSYGGGGGGYGGGGYGGGGYGGGGGYQFGSGGATGDLAATGAAAYGGYGRLARDYGRMGSQGVTGRERANLMAASNEPIQAQGAAQRDIMANRVAQSGNTAGYAGAQARLGANLGQSLVSADRQNQIAILQENQRRKEAGLAGQMGATQGQAGLYTTGAGYVSNLLGGRGRLASLAGRTREEGTETGGSGGISYG